jgi:hypothetical protein
MDLFQSLRLLKISTRLRWNRMTKCRQAVASTMSLPLSSRTFPSACLPPPPQRSAAQPTLLLARPPVFRAVSAFPPAWILKLAVLFQHSKNSKINFSKIFPRRISFQRLQKRRIKTPWCIWEKNCKCNRIIWLKSAIPLLRFPGTSKSWSFLKEGF